MFGLTGKDLVSGLLVYELPLSSKWEYIRLEEENAQKRGKVFNWEIAKYGRIWYDEDIHDIRSVENEFPAIVFNDSLTLNETLFCEPTLSSLNDKLSLEYHLKNDNEKVNNNMPLFPSLEPLVSCINDLDFFKDCKNEFPAIVYNDALTSRSDFLTEPTLCPQHINDFDLKDETSLSEYDEEKQNILSFNDLFSFNIIYSSDLKSDKGNDENEIDMIQSSEGNENTNKLLEESHDQIKKVFIKGIFIMGLNVNIVAWNHFVNGMLFNLIKNLYVPFGISFDPKWYYKDGDCARMLWRPGPMVHELILEFFSTFRFREAILDLDTTGAPQFQLGGAREEARAMIFGGYFVARLAEHFGLVAPGLERQLDAVAGAPGAAEDALVVDEGVQAIPASVQAPQPPPAARTMPQRMARLEEDVHKIRGALAEQRKMIDAMA
nr:hypothetical protein [Tanacetum cinerariifolium]